MTDFELRAHKALAITEIENLMSRHTYYHAADMNREEVTTLWSQKRADEVVWSQNFGRWIGMHKLLPMYAGDDKYEMAAIQKQQILEIHPEYAEKLEEIDGRRLSEMPTHVLCSSVIEIAEDGMSAKGLWYTPGVALRADTGRDVQDVAWMWEKYGADFIYEDGEWKFLRLLICMDMSTGGDTGDWTKPRMPMGPPPEEKKEEKKEPLKGASPAMGGKVSVEKDEPGRFTDYSATRLQVEMPRIPEPFKSLEETWSY